MTVLRIFQTAVDPADLDEAKRVFTDDIVPAFTGLPGCMSIELVLGTEHHPGGLLECAAVSRWESIDAMRAGLDTRVVKEARVRLFALLRQEPLVRVFEVLC